MKLFPGESEIPHNKVSSYVNRIRLEAKFSKSNPVQTLSAMLPEISTFEDVLGLISKKTKTKAK